jgi:dsDNA-binding SOS-regulon protein
MVLEWLQQSAAMLESLKAEALAFLLPEGLMMQ